MSSFKYQGFTMPMWSYRNSTDHSLSISKLLATNANAVIIDFHLETASKTGSIVDYRGDKSLSQLNDAIKTAKSHGLDVWFKPIVIMGKGTDQNSWQGLAPVDPAQWFSTYSAKLVEIAKILQTNGVSHFLLTNELFSMTTNPAYANFWSTLISDVRNVFSGKVGFNAGALLGPWETSNEYLRIPKNVLDQVDFIGLSSYPRVQSSGSFTIDSVAQGWNKSAYGENLLQQLSTYLAAETKPVYFTELGSPAYVGGNYQFRKNLTVDLDSQANFYTATLDLLEKHFPHEIEGIFVYNWLMNLSQGHDSTVTSSTAFDWNIINKPSEIAITKSFSDVSKNSKDGFFIHALNTSQKINGSPGTDIVVFQSKRSDSQVTNTSSVDSIITQGLTYTLTNIERLQFSDKNIALDLAPTQAAGQTALLIGAVLPGKLVYDVSKQALLGSVISLFDQNFTLAQLSGAILRLPIWDILTGKAAPTNTDIAGYLVNNVYGGTQTATITSAAITAMNAETTLATQGTYLASLAASDANQTHVDLVGIQATGLVYLG